MGTGARSWLYSGLASIRARSRSSTRPSGSSCWLVSIQHSAFSIPLESCRRLAGSTLYESPRALLPDERVPLDDHRALRDDHARGALDDSAFVRVVVHAHVERLTAER